MAPSDAGVHRLMLSWNIEIERIRKIDAIQKIDPCAFIGNIADTAES
jgi:hypothetical protein